MAKSRKSNRSKDTADKSAKEAQNDETLTGEILDPETVDADSLTARESSDPEQIPDGVEGEVTDQSTSEEEAAAASGDESGDTQAAENGAEPSETETVDVTACK